MQWNMTRYTADVPTTTCSLFGDVRADVAVREGIRNACVSKIHARKCDRALR